MMRIKRLFFATAFICLVNSGFAQTDSLVGAWYWSDSTKATSIFIKPGGRVKMHTGPKDGVILTKDSREGTYILKGKQLIIQWKNGDVQNYYIKFFNKNRFQLSFIDKQNKNQKRDVIFVKVVDEEVTQP